jgi:hypothetical protein
MTLEDAELMYDIIPAHVRAAIDAAPRPAPTEAEERANAIRCARGDVERALNAYRSACVRLGKASKPQTYAERAAAAVKQAKKAGKAPPAWALLPNEYIELTPDRRQRLSQAMRERNYAFGALCRAQDALNAILAA